MFGRFIEFAFPNAYHAITAFFHIRILRLIESHALGLAMVKGVKLCRVSVPVVAIKLNHRIYRGNKSVNTEFSPNEILPFIRYTDAIEDGIRSTFKIIRLHTLLFGIHTAQMQGALRVFISALDGTVGDIVLFVFAAGWRPVESVTANFARVFCLVSPLPFVSMFYAAKVMLSLFHSGFSRIEHVAAQLTRHILPRFPLGALALSVALQRTKVLAGASVVGDSFLAPNTGKGSNGVFVHTYILPQ